MVNSCQYVNVNIQMNGEQLEEFAPSSNWVQSSMQREPLTKVSYSEHNANYCDIMLHTNEVTRSPQQPFLQRIRDL